MRNRITRKEVLVASIVLIAICYITHFLHWRSYGFYEDDFHFASPALTMTWTEAGRDLMSDLTLWPHGRPLGWSLATGLPFLTYRLVGFRFLWTIEFLILSVSSILCYRVLRDRLPARFAVLGAA